MNITRSDNIETLANVKIFNESVPMAGSYAMVFKIITLQNKLPIAREVQGKRYVDVELDGTVMSPVFIQGFVKFSNGNLELKCPVELRRTASECISIN